MESEILNRSNCSFEITSYPNPTIDAISILTGIDDPLIQQINIKKIDNLSIGVNKVYDGLNFATININHLPNGTYLVEVYNEDGQVSTKTIIKY